MTPFCPVCGRRGAHRDCARCVRERVFQERQEQRLEEKSRPSNTVGPYHVFYDPVEQRLLIGRRRKGGEQRIIEISDMDFEIQSRPLRQT